MAEVREVRKVPRGLPDHEPKQLAALLHPPPRIGLVVEDGDAAPHGTGDDLCAGPAPDVVDLVPAARGPRVPEELREPLRLLFGVEPAAPRFVFPDRVASAEVLRR